MTRAKDLLKRYGVSVLIYLIAFLLTHLLWPLIQPAPVPLFFAGIVAAFWGGFGPGVFVAVISALTIDYFFVTPFEHFEWTSQNLVRIGVFLTVSSIISWLNGTRKRLMDERGKLLIQIKGFNDELRKEVQLATQNLATANDSLLKTQQHLARSERMAVVGQMAASLAHEVGTPLNAISGHLELLADNQANDADTRRRIRIIRQQLDFIVGTVKRLLEWTHKRSIVRQPVNVRKLIQEVLWLVAPTLDEHSIKATLTIDEQLPTLPADRESLQQVFLNLINNAVDAMPVGGSIEITTRLNNEDGIAEIIFQDSGIGIHPDDVPHLFEPMWTTKPSGSGFGLAIVRQVMNDLGGDIQIVEGQAAGAAFRLTLPLRHIDAKSINQSSVISNVA
jgi:signal transduction histidine kinase